MRFAGNGSNVATAADTLKSVAVTIGGTLVLVLALTWAMALCGKNDYVVAFMTVSWIFAFFFSQPTQT